METQQLSTALQSAINAGDRPDEHKIFMKLLRQVWQIDWTVAPYDVWTRYVEWDVPYFLRFMSMDVGDEAEEDQLLQDWIASRTQMKRKETGSDWRQGVMNLITEMCELRENVRKG